MLQGCEKLYKNDAGVKVAGFKHGPCAPCRFCLCAERVGQGKTHVAA